MELHQLWGWETRSRSKRTLIGPFSDLRAGSLDDSVVMTIHIGTVPRNSGESPVALSRDESRVGFVGGTGAGIPIWKADSSLDIYGTDDRISYIELLGGVKREGEIVDQLERASSYLGLETRKPERFAYTVQCSDFGWFSAGCGNFIEELRAPYGHSRMFRDTLASRGFKNLDVDRPCYGVFADLHTGMFWLSLRAEPDGDIPKFHTEGGLILEKPIHKWDQVDDFVGHSGPISQESRSLNRVQLTFDTHKFKRAERTTISGDAAHTIASTNPLHNLSLPAEVDDGFSRSITTPSHIPWRIQNGTSGFENEVGYHADEICITHLDIPYRGIQPYFFTHRCRGFSQ